MFTVFSSPCAPLNPRASAMSLRSLLLLLASAPAFATPWSSDVPLRAGEPGTPAVHVNTVGVAAAGDYWLRTQRSDMVDEILHLDSSGNLLSRARLAERLNSYGPRIFDFFELLPLANGQLYGHRSLSFRTETEISGFTATGEVSWSTVERPLRSWCPQVGATADAGLWLLCELSEGRFQLNRSDAAGRIRTILGSESFGEGGLRGSLAVAADGSAYVGGTNDDDVPTVWAVDAQGQTRWERTLDLPVSHAVKQLAVANDGSLTVATGEPDSAMLALHQLAAADGQPLALHSIDLGDNGGFLDLLRPALNGGSLLIIRGGASDVVARTDADGQLDLLQPLPIGRRLLNSPPQPPALLETDNGELRLLADIYDQQFDRQLEYYAFQAGTLRKQVAIGAPNDFITAAPRPAFGDFLTSGRHGRIDSEGLFHDISLEATVNGLEQPVLLAAHSEGDQRLVVAEQNAARLLQSWTRAGQLSWQQELPRVVTQSGIPELADLQVNASSVCWQIVESGSTLDARLPVICYDRATGAEQLRFDRDQGINTRSQHRLLQGDELVRLVATAEAAELTFTALADGSVTRPSIALTSRSARLQGQAAAPGVAVRDGSRLRVYWTDGQQPEALEVNQDVQEQLYLTAQGLLADTVWYGRDGGPGVELESDLGAFLMDLAEGERFQVVIQPLGSRVLLWGVDAQNDTLVWTRELPSDRTAVSVYPAASPDQVIVVGANGTDLDLHWINRADGSLVQTRSLPCGAPQCYFERGGRISSAAGLDLLERRIDGDTTGALRALHLAEPAPLIRADQPGLAGLWYQPTLSGQGLVLTFLEDSQTLFAPWFNYTRNVRVHDQSQLRWYSLQGQVNSADTVAELQLLENQAGQFAVPPITQAAAIGSARLRFESCDLATLEYGFDPATRLHSMPLVRLGPRTRPCVLADGSVQPPALQVADNHGFSVRQSGAWFDPLTSGQGLMVEMVPAGNGQNGLLFAAWFSYDLAGLADDATTQDWFILQGDLAAAANGMVSVPIFRVIGGEFDRRQTSNVFRVGQAQLQFADCDSLQLSYQFDDSELAQAHAGLQGQQSLQRIGGCTAAR